MLITGNFAVFLVATLTLCAIPGPDMLYVIARSIGQGRKAGIVSAFGFSVGLLVHTCGAALGFSALLMSSPLAYSIVKYVGAAYLIFLGINMLLSKKSISSFGKLKQASFKRIFSQAIITNVLNPKIALFFLAFLPQFVNISEGAVGWQILILGIIFNIIGTLWNIIVAFMAGFAGDWLKNRPKFSRLQQWFTGGVLIFLGIHIALSQIS